MCNELPDFDDQGSMEEIHAAERLDALLDSADAGAELGPVVGELRAAFSATNDAGRAVSVMTDVRRDAAFRQGGTSQMFKGWGRRGAALALILGGTSWGLVPASSNRDMVAPEPSVTVVAPEATDSPADEAEPAVAAEDEIADDASADAERAAELAAGLAEIDQERADAHAEHAAATADATRDRDEAHAELAMERSTILAERDAERAAVGREYQADLRDLERELRGADGADRREIQREIDALRREWDSALAEVDADHADEMAGLDAETAAVDAEFAEAVAEADAELAATLAELDAAETELRAELG